MSETMTPLQKRCRELLPVIQAGAEGKTLEFRFGSSADWTERCGLEGCSFLDSATYRVKPEPKLRPFTTQEAVDNSSRGVVHKPSGDAGYRFSVNREGILVRWDVDKARPGCTSYSMDEFCRLFTFEDGTPCGVLECDC